MNAADFNEFFEGKRQLESRVKEHAQATLASVDPDDLELIRNIDFGEYVSFVPLIESDYRHFRVFPNEALVRFETRDSRALLWFASNSTTVEMPIVSTPTEAKRLFDDLRERYVESRNQIASRMQVEYSSIDAEPVVSGLPDRHCPCLHFRTKEGGTFLVIHRAVRGTYDLLSPTSEVYFSASSGAPFKYIHGVYSRDRMTSTKEHWSATMTFDGGLIEGHSRYKFGEDLKIPGQSVITEVRLNFAVSFAGGQSHRLSYFQSAIDLITSHNLESKSFFADPNPLTTAYL